MWCQSGSDPSIADLIPLLPDNWDLQYYSSQTNTFSCHLFLFSLDLLLLIQIYVSIKSYNKIKCAQSTFLKTSSTEVLCELSEFMPRTCTLYLNCSAMECAVIGADNSLMSACTPRAKLNYMLSQATIKNAGSCLQPFMADGHAVNYICGEQGWGWGESGEKRKKRRGKRLKSFCER